MTNSQRLSQVRSALRQWISVQQPDASDLHQAASEAMLIRDGFFCGRRFRLNDFQAVWFMEEDELKIRDSGGGVLALLTGDQIDRLASDWEIAVRRPEVAEDEVRTLSIADHLENKPAEVAEVERRRAA
jgi:hypothetical protein